MNISYLIENTNHVYVDSKLVEDYSRQTKTDNYKAISPRDAKPMKKQQAAPALKNKSPTNDRLKNAKDIASRTVPSQQATRKMNSQVFSEDECIQILSAKVQSIRESQRQSEAHYINVLSKLRQDVQRVDQEYNSQVQIYQRIRIELADTKRDIAQLMEIIQSAAITRANEISARTNGSQKEQVRSLRDMP